jgi:hypothetical protein
MEDGRLIALSVAGFGALTWLLGISFLLGRYTNRVDNLEAALVRWGIDFAAMLAKLDTLVAVGPHRCVQSSRIAVLEDRLRIDEGEDERQG